MKATVVIGSGPLEVLRPQGGGKVHTPGQQDAGPSSRLDDGHILRGEEGPMVRRDGTIRKAMWL